MTVRLEDERMSDVDAVVWAVEREPRLRTTIAALAVFARPLDLTELRHRVDRASRLIPRLRQRVVTDPIGITAPRWTIDPDFRLSFHLRTTHLSDADHGRLLEVARNIIVQPLDRRRPLWEFTYITGLPDDASALLLKAHHAVSDGVGGVKLMLELFDIETVPAADRATMPEAPMPALRSPTVSDNVRHEIGATFDTAKRALAPLLGELPRDAKATAHSLGAMLGSAARMFAPGGPSSIPRHRSAALDLRTCSAALVDLREAAERIGGTVNDAFVAAVGLAIRDYFRHGDAEPSPLRISIPMSIRTDDDGVGNHWTPGRIDLYSTGSTSPDDAMREVRRRVAHLRRAPAHDLFPPIAAGLRRLPDAATSTTYASLSAALDVAASNVPGSPAPLHLCGEPVDELIPFGPLSGCAVNATLLSHGEEVRIGVSSDPAAVSDPDRLQQALADALTAVVKGS